jgi:protein-S-isoprenylcysteine O-methyltransferase Ste14
MSDPYILQGFLAILWCTLHSLLIAPGVNRGIRKLLGVRYSYHRIIYNLFSAISLLPVIYLEYSLRDIVIFDWHHPVFQFLRIVLFILSIVFFYLGGLQYSGAEFLGISQIRTGQKNTTLSSTGSLNTSGILAVTRHPWYLGALMIIWLRNIYDTVLIVNSIFSIYLIVGSILEERKLVREFGGEYRNYRKQVSMLIPWKWMFKFVKRRDV